MFLSMKNHEFTLSYSFYMTDPFIDYFNNSFDRLTMIIKQCVANLKCDKNFFLKPVMFPIWFSCETNKIHL